MTHKSRLNKASRKLDRLKRKDAPAYARKEKALNKALRRLKL